MTTKKELLELQELAEGTQEALDKVKDARNDLKESIKAQIELMGEEGEQARKVLKLQNELNAAKVAGASNTAELKAQLEDEIKTLEEQDKALANNFREQEKLSESVRVYTQHVRENREELKEYQKELDKQIKKIELQRRALDAAGQAADRARSGFDTLTKSSLANMLSLRGFIEGIIDAAHKLDTLDVGLARSTGRIDEFGDNLRDAVKNNQDLGISLEEANKVITDFSLGMTRFNLVGDKQQRVLQRLAFRFKRLGVDSGDFAPALDRINFGFGITGEAAAAAAASLESMSDEVGRPLDAVLKDFNELGPTLARFGQRGPEVFRKLNRQARELGLTVRQAFDFTEMFDTFESAANVAGRLNAQLGLQLNSVELLRASSEDRLEILRKEFQLQGRNFQSMGRRQKQMIASILQTDEETAARLLGEGMDISQFQRQTTEKNLNDVVTIQEKMVAAQDRMTIELADPLKNILKTITNFATSFASWGPQVLAALVAGKALSMAARGGFALRAAQLGGTGIFAQGMPSALATAGTGAMGALRAVPILGQVLGGGAQAAMEYSRTGSAGRAAAVGAGGLTGGLAGAAAGASLGAFGGPLGMLIGGVIGGIGGQLGGGALVRSIMGKAKPEAEKTMKAESLKRAASQQRSEADRTIEVKEMTLPIRMIVDGREFSPIVEKAMNIKLNPVTPR